MSTFLFITRTNGGMQSKVVRHAIIPIIITNSYAEVVEGLWPSRAWCIPSTLFSRRCSSFQANAFAAEFHGRARGRLPSTTVVVVPLVERSSTFAPRVGTLRWKRSSKTGPQLTISPWDRASAKRPRIKLGFSINEKTFQPENNSRIDTRSYPVHRRSYFLSKKKSNRPLSRHTPRPSFPLSLYRSVIVNRVTRGTPKIGKMRRHCIVRVVMK